MIPADESIEQVPAELVEAFTQTLNGHNLTVRTMPSGSRLGEKENE